MLLIPSIPSIEFSPSLNRHHHRFLITNTTKQTPHKTAKKIFISTVASVAILLSTNMSAIAIVRNPLPDAAETLENIPQTLSGECVMGQDGDCKKGRIQKPKSRKAESCTINCVTTCIRGGDGLPGEGPLVVFKQGFRSRHYYLVECSDICNLIRDGDDGP